MLDVLLSPALLLGLVVALLYAALFHLWQGRTLRDLGVFALAALVGFAVGQGLGQLTNLKLLDVGQVNMAEATLFSLLALFVANRLKV
ncbi:MAG TPA: hypothetical protein VM537_31545 [Anaerolineae bacterium]|jgi:hypothetical protein|nr:hypothetical protein [Anaerolineae bacterium]